MTFLFHCKRSYWCSPSNGEQAQVQEGELCNKQSAHQFDVEDSVNEAKSLTLSMQPYNMHRPLWPLKILAYVSQSPEMYQNT